MNVGKGMVVKRGRRRTEAQPDGAHPESLSQHVNRPRDFQMAAKNYI